MAQQRQPKPRLRVAVAAADPVRQAGLAAIVRDSGHTVVDTADAADVLLADAVPVGAAGIPVVTLGGAEMGQAGVLPAEAGTAQIDAALRAVAAGLIVRSAAAAPQPQHGFAGYPDAAAPLLTPREIEVLAAIGDGLSNKEVARRLGISQHTVKFHVEALFQKLDATSRAEAVHKGLKRGLIEL
jgi:two-component system, NarL family, nitrate/nitrite response regulator NarL